MEALQFYFLIFFITGEMIYIYSHIIVFAMLICESGTISYLLLMSRSLLAESTVQNYFITIFWVCNLFNKKISLFYECVIVGEVLSVVIIKQVLRHTVPNSFGTQKTKKCDFLYFCLQEVWELVK